MAQADLKSSTQDLDNGGGDSARSSQRAGRAYVVPPPPEFQNNAKDDKDANYAVQHDITETTQAGMAALARYSMHASQQMRAADVGDPRVKVSAGVNDDGSGWGADDGDNATTSPTSPGPGSMGWHGARTKWLRTMATVEGSVAARRMREAARLKALQRTPYPMVLARLKLLLERLSTLQSEAEGVSRSGSPERLGRTSPDLSSPSAKPQRHGKKSPSLKARRPQAGVAGPPGTSPSKPSAVGQASPAGGRGGPGSVTAGTPATAAAAAAAAAATGAGAESAAPELPPIEKVREELAITFAYVSEFLRKVPEGTRNACIDLARMEAYKKDQNVYMIGDAPNKFYMILTGAVEVWAHPANEPRKRTVLACLKRGQSFGEKDILNGELRTECVTPTSNCTFLVLDADPFVTVFSDHFEQLLARAQDFFMHHVHMCRKVPSAHGLAIVRHMLLSVYPPGKEWEPATEPQIYFIKSGTATLESHDRRAQSVVVTRSMLGLTDGSKEGDPDAPAVGEVGVLSNVVMRDGRAVGTLGHEEEIRNLKRQLIPKRVLATLGKGSSFGGGPAALGSGDMQSSLRVMATTEVEAYHCHIEVFLKHASPELLSALRDDAAFKMTYSYGRAGMLAADTIVGHAESLLATCLHKPRQGDAVSLPGTMSHETPAPHAGGTQPLGTPSLTTPGGPKANGAQTRRRRAQKHVHQPGQYNPEVEKALEYIHSLQAHSRLVQAGAQDSMARAKLVGKAAAEGVLPVPGYTEYLLTEGMTPSQRFWSVPSLCASSARIAALTPLLKQVYPEGLGPLAVKLDQLMARTTATARDLGCQLQATALVRNRVSTPGNSSAAPQMTPGARAGSPTSALAGAPSRLRNMAAGGGAVSSPSIPAIFPSAATHSASPAGISGSLGRPGTGLVATKPSAGALLSANLVWEREQEVSRTPGLRQCLTYEEIAMLKADIARAAARPAQPVLL